MRLRARHYATGEPLNLEWHQGTLIALGPADRRPVDLEAGWVAPALFDLQINGCHGHSFNSPRVDGSGHLPRGQNTLAGTPASGRCVPTLVTNSFGCPVDGYAHPPKCL